MIQTFINGEWVSQHPTHGQKYRKIIDNIVVLESYWADPNIPVITPNTRITRLAFRQRFTFSERVAIETATETDATVRVMVKDQESATFIDLARQDTIDGLGLLVSKGLITEQRATEILTNPVQAIEQLTI